MENFYFAAGYTLLLMIVAAYYYFHGKKVGIEEACSVFKEKEPKAFANMKAKLLEDLNVRAEE